MLRYKMTKKHTIDVIAFNAWRGLLIHSLREQILVEENGTTMFRVVY